jgi:tyramine---L-glutamate ligase
MKILVFEYSTGGGFNTTDLPEALASEGLIMLNALLDCLIQVKAVELILMLDWRLSDAVNTVGMDTVFIQPQHDTFYEFERLAARCDAVWPIAPEFDGILEILCQQVESLNKYLLTSPASAVRLTGNKWLTFNELTRHHIATVETRLFKDVSYTAGEWLIKPVDGAGCNNSYLIANEQDFASLAKKLPKNGEFIIQPHLEGDKTSLSCLFKDGQGWLLCANLQHFQLLNEQYQLKSITVNYTSDLQKYGSIVKKIASAFPALWGYAGIDLIETADGIVVLEINPRLTTSFAGIQAARGINVGQCVLDLLTGNRLPNPQHDKSVTLTLEKDCHAV